MINISLIPKEKIYFFLLFFVYAFLISFTLPVALGLFLSTLLQPIIKQLYFYTKVPYLLVVLITSSLFFYAIYSSLLFLIDSFKVLLPELQFYFAQQLFTRPPLSYVSDLSISLLEQLSTFAISTFRNIFHYLIEFFIFLLAFYFSLFEGKRNPYWFFVYTPKLVRASWQRYYMLAMQLFRTFLFVELRLLLLTFFLLACGFSVLGFSYPLQKALFIALADCLPILGIGLFLVPVAIYFYVTNELLLCCAIILLYVLIQLTRQLTESYLWASTFHLRTIHTFTISAASVLIFGFYGILLSPLLLMLAVKLKQSTIFAR